MSEIRTKIQALIESGVSAHTVAKETCIPRNTVYRIFTGEAALDNVTLKNAEILSNYFIERGGGDMNKANTMLDLYQKQFDEIMCDTEGRKRTLLLANLMTQMEHYYEISMIKEIFERETPADVKELYLAVSNAREI